VIRWHLSLALFRKEIIETLRDQRTLLLAFGLPILLYPLLAIGLTKVQESRSEAQNARASKVAIWGPLAASVRTELEKTNRFEIKPGLGLSPELSQDLESGKLPPFPSNSREESRGTNKPSASVSSQTGPGTKAIPRPPQDLGHPLLNEAARLIASREVDAVLVLWPGFDSALDAGGLSKSAILYDSVRDESSRAHVRLSDSLIDLRKAELSRRESKFQLPSGFSKAVEIEKRDLALPLRQAGKVIGSMLPLLLIIMSASGGLYAAIDLTAGEKERNTLQTLLCAPLTSLEIITGKFLAAWVVVLMTTLANAASMGATFTRILSSAGGIEAPMSAYFMAFLVMLPATFMVTAIFLAVAVFARDFKDGQNLLTPMFMVLMLPLAGTSLPGVELDAWTAFVPLLNICLLIKGIFLQEAATEMVFLVLASSVVYAAMALSFAAHVFQQEQVLLGGRGSWKSVLQFKPQRSPVPSPSLALLTFAGAFVLMFYGGHLLAGSGMVVLILMTQILFFLGPNVVVGWRWGLSMTETYALRRPSWQAVAGAVLIGLTAWGVTAGVVMRLFPPPEGFSKALEKALLFENDNLPLVFVVLLVGATPAICEELFFRGLILSGFRRFGFWPALIASSFLFAIAHSSIYRLLPTFMLGMIIGWAAMRSGSIFTGMIIHGINNSLLVIILHNRDWLTKLGLDEHTEIPWTAGIGMLALTGVGLWLTSMRPIPGRTTQPILKQP